MIYTSYFAVARRFPKLSGHYNLVSIAAMPPTRWDKAKYKKLAPTYGCLTDYKRDNDFEAYKKRYMEEVLSKLDQGELIGEIIRSLPNDDQMRIEMVNCPIWENPNDHLVLFCFEKSGEPCHRNIVSEWLSEAGIRCEEFKNW